MPSAIVIKATAVNPGDFNAIRTPYRRSWNRVSIIPRSARNELTLCPRKRSTPAANIIGTDRQSFLAFISTRDFGTVHYQCPTSETGQQSETGLLIGFERNSCVGTDAFVRPASEASAPGKKRFGSPRGEGSGRARLQPCRCDPIKLRALAPEV